MSQGLHLLVPFAACPAAACRDALRGLELPGLSGLLARLEPVADDPGEPQDLSLPHERFLARAAGLWGGDGRIPQAAWQLQREGQDPGGAAWAWLTPCHWRVGRDHIRMDPPQALGLREEESQALLQAMQPYFAEDGLDVRYREPLRWLAHGEIFRELPCASLDRVAGQRVDDWLPRAAEARPVRRLQQEMQMLLYTHPVNEAREAEGLATVNSLWVSGAGALPPGQLPADPGLQVHEGLREPALAGDGPAWARAWRELDATALAGLRAALDAGQDVRLTLCGAATARTWAPAPGAWRRRLARVFRSPPPLPALLESL